MDEAVILARGLSKRMQKADDAAGLTDEQTAVAEIGIKALIPVGRPFLDYVISGLADAGFQRICLVIGPEHEAVRKYYQTLKCRRVSIEFAIQVKPLGTADAVAAAEEFSAGDEFLVINSDNYYPVHALRVLRELDEPALAGFDRTAMLSGSNIEPDRVVNFAIVETSSDGYLTRIVEKPSPDVLAILAQPVCVSMNCWRFGPAIFAACRSISPSPRGELELPDAVGYAVDSLGERFRVVPVQAPVLDLTSQKDIAPVAAKLANVEVSL